MTSLPPPNINRSTRPRRWPRVAWMFLGLLLLSAPNASAEPAGPVQSNPGQSDSGQANNAPSETGQDAADVRNTNVGMLGRIKELKLPGSELEVIPLKDRDTPIVVRIVRTFPHGSDFRYEIEYYGLEPGTYDLRDFLQRSDGSDIDAVPSIPVTVTPVLSEEQVEPNQLTPGTPPRLGGYQLLLIGGVILWVIVLLLIIFWRRKSKSGNRGGASRPQTLAERLRPLVDRAVAGEATHAELASLERSLLTYWRKRLDLNTESSSQAIRQLKSHPEAGGLMTQLENWLHHPEAAADVDVNALLKPYRNVSERELQLEQNIGNPESAT